MQMTQKSFYKSKQWLDFRKVIIEQRTDVDGFVHCADCGKPILKKYDLIIHHKKELSDDNVNDASVSLNPDNVEVVCFRCHNKEHDRWQGGNNGWKPVQKKVFIVYGSPAAGKTTWVHSVATEDDLIVDMDSIWQMVSVNERYDKPAALKSVVFQIRDSLYDIIKYRSGKWHNAYIITGGAMQGDRDRLKVRVAADEMIFIDTAQDECIKRIRNRNMTDDAMLQWIGFINEWFERFQPEETLKTE